MVEDEENRGRGTWPSWMEPLRPDEEARARLRVRIDSEVRSLPARPPGGGIEEAWGVAEDWARHLVPLAAAAALLLGWMAARATAPVPDAPAAESPVAVEELVRPDTSGTFPEVLISAAEPDDERLVSAVMYGVGFSEGRR